MRRSIALWMERYEISAASRPRNFPASTIKRNSSRFSADAQLPTTQRTAYADKDGLFNLLHKDGIDALQMGIPLQRVTNLPWSFRVSYARSPVNGCCTVSYMASSDRSGITDLSHQFWVR
eukprot:gnl/MRDRNA2_/MRDRNA2_23769_c0_seq1.p1 gnl/MRDRNA2_/MRDRNA2_23769_c0~~gnl/MRDRNA2_/MRDRNA2_23769_c0_seq1.p1  ORF type:complete len:120 (-),score=7.20 gnl/MRDRNA2_/MRDRNA2_23769_c0_seq1:293-652(-)